MRFVVPFLFVFYPIAIFAQSSPEWSRVYTFDESTIEINTSLITRIDKDVTRLRFRWMFDKPERADGLTYQSQLEVMEFNCSVNKYRSYHLTLLDKAGNIVRIQDSPSEWRAVISGSMMEKLFVPGCELIKEKTTVKSRSEESAQLKIVAQYAYDFAQQLQDTKDFKVVINRFFVADYVNNYVNDQQTNWFINLNRDTVTKATSKDLERYYVALMNTDYLTGVFVISQLSSDLGAVEKMVPDVVQLLNQHPYAVQYQTKKDDYDFLAEPIGDVDRLRSYTDLLEKISSLMRAHVKTVKAEQTASWKEMFDEWNLFQPKPRVCSTSCLGLAKGTKIFDVDVPLFHLQIAEISGQLKIISATTRQ